MTDNRHTIAVQFSDEEMELLQGLPGNRDPAELARDVLLDFAIGMAEQPVAEDPEEPDSDQPEALELPVALAADTSLLERMDRLEALVASIPIWCQTVLSEIYAHTGFADAASEKAAREKAERKIIAIRAAVEREVSRQVSEGAVTH